MTSPKIPFLPMSPSSPRNYRRPRQDQTNSAQTGDTASSTSTDVQSSAETRAVSGSLTVTSSGTSETSSSSSSSDSSSSSSSSSSQSSSFSSEFSSSSSAFSSSSRTGQSRSTDSSTSRSTPVTTSVSSSSVITTTSSLDTSTTDSILGHIPVTVVPIDLSSSSPTSSPVSTLVTPAQSTPSFTSSQSTVGASSKGFWSDKKAVAGTFTALALVILGIGFSIVICFIKKRRRDKERDRDTLFDKYPPEPGLVSPRPISSSTHSMSEDLHRRPMNPDAGGIGDFNYQHQNSNPFHDPVYPNGSLTEITYSYAKDVNNQYPAYDGDLLQSSTNSSSQHLGLNPPAQRYLGVNGSSGSISNPFRDPSPSAVTSGRRVPGARSKIQALDRDSYQPSLDSFYGVEPAREGVGYAR